MSILRPKPIDSRQPFGVQIDLTSVNLLAQEADLVSVALFRDLGPPAFRSAVEAVVPAIAASFECVFEVERTMFCPNPAAPFVSRSDEVLERGAVRAVSIRKNLEKGMAIVDRPVAVVEQAALTNKVAQLGTLEAKPMPVHFLVRAGPCQKVETGCEVLAEGAIKTGVVGDDQISVLSDNRDENGATDRMRMPPEPVSKGGRSPTEAPAPAAARSQ